YFGGDTRAIVPELAEVRPTFLPSVPRIFEKLYTALEGAPPAMVRAVFGGQLRMALSGAAPISPAVLEFFDAAGVPVLEGYAMTESAGVGTVNTVAHHRIGSVGIAAPGTEVAVAEDGEVLLRGPHVFAGYWRDPAATAATVVDGWLHTGDLGALAAHPEVRALLQEIVDGVNGRYARALQIKRFAVLPRDLTQEAGELTPTLKVKRSIVYTNHAAALAALYADGEPDGRG